MIDVALKLIQSELNNYLESHNDPSTAIVDNIALLETSEGDSLKNSIIITLVNVEEENTLKNTPPLNRPFNNGIATYQNPPVFLNLYVLFTCNYSGDNYILALQRLSLIIKFLQSKNSFSITSTLTPPGFPNNDDDVMNLKFSLELFTLSFEQINYLWGSLGGRQMPFVMYKLRLVGLTERLIVREVPLIEEIETNSRPI